jgi:hypothetical protein
MIAEDHWTLIVARKILLSHTLGTVCAITSNDEAQSHVTGESSDF